MYVTVLSVARLLMGLTPEEADAAYQGSLLGREVAKSQLRAERAKGSRRRVGRPRKQSGPKRKPGRPRKNKTEPIE